ncbi:MAG: 50S ribosomal protein L25 [Deltaproteobacteria bacterium]|nr:50S ribosomal protein L25 [Deltaproteobacteria bacterium]
MEQVDMTAWPRKELGKGACGRLRKEGLIPAVLYGPGMDENFYLKLNTRDVEKSLSTHSSGNMLVNLKVEGERDRTVMFKTLTRDPIRDTIEHIDLLNIIMDRKVIAEIPVVITGRAIGVVDGGILQHETRKLRVECLPLQIPDKIEVDVTGLAIGDSIHVRDLSLPEGIRIKDDEGTTIALVSAPAAEVEVKPAVAEVPLEATPAEGAEKAEKPEKGEKETGNEKE